MYTCGVLLQEVKLLCARTRHDFNGVSLSEIIAIHEQKTDGKGGYMHGVDVCACVHLQYIVVHLSRIPLSHSGCPL